MTTTYLHADTILYALAVAGAKDAGFLSPVVRNGQGDGWLAVLHLPGGIPPRAELHIALDLGVETTAVRLTRITDDTVRLEVDDQVATTAPEPTIPVAALRDFLTRTLDALDPNPVGDEFHDGFRGGERDAYKAVLRWADPDLSLPGGPGWRVEYVNVETGLGDWHARLRDDGTYRVVDGHTSDEVGTVSPVEESRQWQATTPSGAVIDVTYDFVHAVLLVANREADHG